MASLQTAPPSRSWSLAPSDGAHVGGAEVTVSDDGVIISVDHTRPERYQCGLEEYLTAVPLAGHSALRDIVRRSLPEAAAMEIADDVKRRLQGRPIRHVGEVSPRGGGVSWTSTLVLVLLGLAAVAIAVTIWR